MKTIIDNAASEAVTTEFNKQVAFFNIGQKHAFFLCSPDEARYAMDCVREWRVKKPTTRDLVAEREAVVARRDAFRLQIVKDRRWESVPTNGQIISTGGTLSLTALNMAFACIEANFRTIGPAVDVIVVGGLIWADMRSWGATVVDLATAEETRTRGLIGIVFQADIYLDNTLPPDIVLIGSMPCDKWVGMCSKVEVKHDSPYIPFERKSKKGAKPKSKSVKGKRK